MVQLTKHETALFDDAANRAMAALLSNPVASQQMGTELDVALREAPEDLRGQGTLFSDYVAKVSFEFAKSMVLERRKYLPPPPTEVPPPTRPMPEGDRI